MNKSRRKIKKNKKSLNLYKNKDILKEAKSNKEDYNDTCYSNFEEINDKDRQSNEDNEGLIGEMGILDQNQNNSTDFKEKSKQNKSTDFTDNKKNYSDNNNKKRKNNTFIKRKRKRKFLTIKNSKENKTSFNENKNKFRENNKEFTKNIPSTIKSTIDSKNPFEQNEKHIKKKLENTKIKDKELVEKNKINIFNTKSENKQEKKCISNSIEIENENNKVFNIGNSIKFRDKMGIFSSRKNENEDAHSQNMKNNINQNNEKNNRSFSSLEQDKKENILNNNIIESRLLPKENQLNENFSQKEKEQQINIIINLLESNDEVAQHQSSEGSNGAYIQNNDYAWDLDDNQQNFNDFEEDVINNELLNDLNEDNDDNNLRKEIFPNIQCNQVGIFWK